MKKSIIFIIVTILAMVACSKEELSLIPYESVELLSAQADTIRSYSTDGKSVLYSIYIKEIYTDGVSKQRVDTLRLENKVLCSVGQKRVQTSTTNKIVVSPEINFMGVDTIKTKIGGWQILTLRKKLRVNYKSNESPKDSFEGDFSYENYIVTYEDPLIDDVKFNETPWVSEFDFYLSHTLDKNVKYENGKFVDRDFDINDIPSDEGINVNGDWFLRYAMIAKMNVILLGQKVENLISNTVSYETDYWVPYKKIK